MAVNSLENTAKKTQPTIEIAEQVNLSATLNPMPKPTEGIPLMTEGDVQDHKAHWGWYNAPATVHQTGRYKKSLIPT